MEAAARETREEAGLVGRLGRRICEVTEPTQRTTIFAMYVEAELEKWSEDSERTRRWFDLGVAGSAAAEKNLATVREHLSPKLVHQQTLRACERQALMHVEPGPRC